MLPFDSQSISLVMRLSHRASRVFKAFTDKEVMEVLSALVILGQHDEELLAAMEKHLPGVCGFIFPQPDFGETCLFGSKWTSILQALSNPQVLCCVCVCVRTAGTSRSGDDRGRHGVLPANEVPLRADLRGRG